MLESENIVNMFYIVIDSHEEAGKTVYDCISTKYEQAAFSEEEIKIYLKMGIISAGAKLEGDKVLLPSAETKQAKPAKEEKKPEPKQSEPAKNEKKPEQKQETVKEEKK